MNKRIHIGWVVALVAAVIAVQGLAQPVRQGLMRFQIAINETLLVRIDTQTGALWVKELDKLKN